MRLANSVSNRPGAWQGPAGAAKSPGRDGAATRSPSGALNVRDGCPWAGQRALQGEKWMFRVDGAAGDCRGQPGILKDGQR